MTTLYDVLGIPTTATSREVKRAYKEQALKCHPDRPGGDPEMFKAVNEAYDLLIEDDQREKYLQLLNAGSGSNVLEQFVRSQAMQCEEQGLAKPSSKYERTCRNWAKGRCSNSNCLYRHYKTAESEKTKINKVCHDFAKGHCRFGEECQFKHPGRDDAGGGGTQVTTWVCNDIWRNCKAENDILQNPRKCKECGARRKVARQKFLVGTTVQLTGSHGDVMAHVRQHLLFFYRDGVYRKQMNAMLLQMQTVLLHGQMVPTVTRFYPSANCYHIVFQDGSFLVVPEKYLKRGEEKWQCAQCKYLNPFREARCGLCSNANPNPVQDWTPFLGTWKSHSGEYYIKVEEHNVSSSEPSHYYTNLRLRDGVLSYKVTVVEDEESDADEGSSDEGDETLGELGEVRLVCDGAKHLSGELVMHGGETQKATFSKVEVLDQAEDDALSSSSFDSRESTPTRERRLQVCVCVCFLPFPFPAPLLPAHTEEGFGPRRIRRTASRCRRQWKQGGASRGA